MKEVDVWPQLTRFIEEVHLEDGVFDQQLVYGTPDGVGF